MDKLDSPRARHLLLSTPAPLARQRSAPAVTQDREMPAPLQRSASLDRVVGNDPRTHVVATSLFGTGQTIFEHRLHGFGEDEAASPGALGPELFAQVRPERGTSYRAQRAEVARALVCLGYRGVTTQDVPQDFARAVIRAVRDGSAEPIELPEELRTALKKAPAEKPARAPRVTRSMRSQPVRPRIEVPTEVRENAGPELVDGARQALSLGEILLGLPKVTPSMPHAVAKQIASAHAKLGQEVDRLLGHGLPTETERALGRLARRIGMRVRQIVRCSGVDFSNCETAYIGVEAQVRRAADYAQRQDAFR